MNSSNRVNMNSCSDKNDADDKIENWSKSSLCKEEKNTSQSSFSSSKENYEDKNLTIRPLSKRKLLGGEQWSQEENSEEVSLIESPKHNGHTFHNEEGKTSSNPSNCSRQCFTHNNNLIIDKSNLRTSDEKSCCFYMKFPLKVNNNVYPEKPLNMKDGMEDYFEQFSLSTDAVSGSCNTRIVCSEDSVESSSKSHCGDHCEHDNLQNGEQSYPESENYQNGEISSYPDQINPLNGEEEDEDDSCIYTYKGENYEANLTHLLQTCFSCGLPTVERFTNQNGAISIQRILNGSPHPKPNPQSNLYSPEMDFLEMDFDPGSNGDGGDSDCEDNNSILNVDSKIDDNSLENFSKLQTSGLNKTINIPNEIRSLMCRRCELCTFNEQKVNNTANSLTKTNSDTNFTSNLQSANDDRPSVKSFNDSQFKQNLNVCGKSISSIVKSRVSASRLMNDKCDTSGEITDQRNMENNLNMYEREPSIDLSDGGDEADDEGGDDSISDPTPGEGSLLFNPCASDYVKDAQHFSASKLQDSKGIFSQQKGVKQLRFSSQNTYAKTSSSTLPNSHAPVVRSELSEQMNLREDSYHKASNENNNNNSNNNNSNNNLGSISAPEVSPSKEYSPVDKFSRSISFHNQLSSPKYENVCFSHPYKDNFVPSINKFQSSTCNSYDYCNCKTGNSSCKFMQHVETTNLEACVDRLNQREKSVFNITSNVVNTSQDYSSNSNYDSFNNGSGVAAFNGENSKSSSQCSLPRKILQPKVNDSFGDPNTVSENNIEKEKSAEEEKELTETEKVMIWTERQATFRQVSQVAASACGPTAVINVLLALDQSRPVKVVTSSIQTRLRAENAPLCDYLLSRSNAGTTHEDLIRGIETISEGAVKGKFFHMFPKRAFQLSRWLTSWIKKGGVPLATLNLQVGVHPGQTVPDAWHHQMVFGVGPQGIYLTNPLECVSDSLLSDQLCSDSVLLVRRSDVVSRWDQNDKLIRLSLLPDPRWNEMNVLGQVVGVLKEDAAPETLQGRRHLTSHVAIPASYQSGVSIFIRSDNSHLEELLSSPELPLLDE